MNNLSKSKYITFCQCPKALWLKMYKPEEIEIDPLTQARFDAGTEVGNLAKSLFGEYTEATVCKMTADGNQRPDLQAMIAATQKLITDGTDNIAEAAFIYDGCYCAVDLLHKTPQGYAIYEVKSSTDLKELEVYAQDVAYQKYVLTNCGLTITGTYLVNIDNEYVLDGELDVKGFFRINDISEAVANEYIKVPALVKAAKKVLEGGEPKQDLAEYCKKPYACSFWNYCSRNVIPSPSVFNLYRMSFKKALEHMNEGRLSLEDMRQEKLTDLQQLQLECTLGNTSYINKKAIGEFLKKLSYPLYFLDFETEQTVIPKYQGTHPYQQELHRDKLFNYDSQMLTSSMVNNADLLKGIAGVLGYKSMTATDLSASYENVNRYVSVYGNAAYTYDDRYSLTGSLRWDRSNLWGTSSKFQNKPIWSVGASWIISKEKFFHADWVNYLKLRVSDGIAGNVSKNSAPYMVASYNNNGHVGGTQGYVQSRANPMLSWEKTNTFNIGIDFSLFKNRLNGTVEYYDKKGTDLLASSMGVPTEGWGYSTYTINNGEMYNRGVEISLSGEVLRTRDFSWRANMTYAYNKNEVTYVNVKAPVYILQLDYPSAYPIIGNEYNAIYGYKWAGLSEEGLPQVYNENGEKVTNQPTTLDAISYMGTTTPKYSGSFGTSISYKDFDFSMQFLFAGGHKMRNANPAFLTCSYSSVGYISNIAGASAGLANRWQKPGDEAYTNVPKAVFAESGLSASSLYSTYFYSDINILDASYIRLNNISLAYHLPKSLCRSLYMQSARVQANVENPFFWAKTKQAKYQLGGYNATNYVLGIYLNF